MATDREKFELNTAKQILILTVRLVEKEPRRREREKERKQCQQSRNSKST